MAPRNKYTRKEMIEEAKREVRVATERVYDSYVQVGLRMKVPFLGFGVQYIRFAKEEPQLYRLLFLPQIRKKTAA